MNESAEASPNGFARIGPIVPKIDLQKLKVADVIKNFDRFAYQPHVDQKD